MDPMTYKGHAARIDSDEDGLFVGRIAGIRDVVGFHGESVAALRQAFSEAMDNYLETCARIDRSPQKPIWEAEPASGTDAARFGCGEGRAREQEHQSVGGRCSDARNACLKVDRSSRVVGGSRVVALSGGTKALGVIHDPHPQRNHLGEQLSPQRRQFILHARRDLDVIVPQYQAVSFQLPQAAGQHPLRDAIHAPAYFSVAQPPRHP